MPLHQTIVFQQRSLTSQSALEIRIPAGRICSLVAFQSARQTFCSFALPAFMCRNSCAMQNEYSIKNGKAKIRLYRMTGKTPQAGSTEAHLPLHSKLAKIKNRFPFWRRQGKNLKRQRASTLYIRLCEKHIAKGHCAWPHTALSKNKKAYFHAHFWLFLSIAHYTLEFATAEAALIFPASVRRFSPSCCHCFSEKAGPVDLMV